MRGHTESPASEKRDAPRVGRGAADASRPPLATACTCGQAGGKHDVPRFWGHTPSAMNWGRSQPSTCEQLS